MVLPIVKYPNPILSTKCQEVKKFDKELAGLISDMSETLRNYDGVGLAAPQVGAAKKIILISYDNKKNGPGKNTLVLVNPKIVWKSSERNKAIEGCLSFPGLELEVERANKIKLKAQNQKGEYIKVKAQDILARIIQHEYDHSQGIVFTKRTKKLPAIAKGNIIFFTTDNFGLEILVGLVAAGYKISAIVTDCTKPSGRGRKISKSQAQLVAERLEIPLLEIEDVKDKNAEDKIRYYKPDLGIVASYGHILPTNIFKIPKYGIINVHPSLLPKYRGASPIASAIISGEKQTGVTLIKISEKVDQGGIIAQAIHNIDIDDTTEILQRKLTILANKLLIQTLPDFIDGKIKPQKQKESEASSTKKIKKEDGLINWKKPTKYIERQIRAYKPWPGTYTFLHGKRIIIHKAHLNKDGQLVLDIVQPEGKKPMPASAFAKGNKKLLTALPAFVIIK